MALETEGYPVDAAFATHALKVVIDKDTVCLSVVCHLLDGATCRRACTEGCEDTCADPDDHIKPVDYCLVAEWINLEGAIAESYSGNDVLPLHDGMAIDVEWTGDDYVWAASHG
jgi:hypothetical protein